MFRVEMTFRNLLLLLGLVVVAVVAYRLRNTVVLLGLALGYAEVVGAFDIFFGANVYDYSGYPDCRPEFYRAFQQAIGSAWKARARSAGRSACRLGSKGASKGSCPWMRSCATNAPICGEIWKPWFEKPVAR